MNTFDASRAILLDHPEPSPCTVETYLPMQEALTRGLLHPDDHCLVAAHGSVVLVLPTLLLVYHHVAQGRCAGQDWMIAFCCLCNAGSFYSAEHQGRVLTFAPQGYYDMMILIADAQTGSYWNHLTGECLTGPSAGQTLTQLGGLMQMTAQAALAAFPEAVFGQVNEEAEAVAIGRRWNARYRLPETPDYGELAKTLGDEDTRLPRHDMGLGIWTPHTRRYYPLSRLYAAHNALVDEVDGRTVVVCIDEAVGLPTVFYCETERAVQERDGIYMDGGLVYRRGVLYRGAQPIPAQRPHHNAIRWYGFAALFPACEIYGQVQRVRR